MIVRRRDACGLERVGIGLAFVAQRIEPRGADDRGRQPGEVFGAQRRNPPVRAVPGVAEVVAGEPLHHRARQEIAFGVFGAGGKARVLPGIREISGDIGHGIDQQLRGEFDPFVAAGDRDCRGQIAARAVAGYADAGGISPELANAFENVAHRGEGVLERAGKADFWRTSVVDGDDDGAGFDREPARLPVMGLEIAGDPAATVEKHHGR